MIDSFAQSFPPIDSSWMSDQAWSRKLMDDAQSLAGLFPPIFRSFTRRSSRARIQRTRSP